MKHKIVRCAALVTFAVPLAALAHSMTFDSADANHDGMVSRAEWNAAANSAAGAGTSGNIPARDIEERSKGIVHERAPKAASGGTAGISVQRPPLPQRDIEERSKGIKHEPNPAVQPGR